MFFNMKRELLGLLPRESLLYVIHGLCSDNDTLIKRQQYYERAITIATLMLKKEMLVMFAHPVVMIDFETSGMSPGQGGRVTEVAAIRIVGNQIVDRFVSLINCGVEIPSFITQLTGINQEMVDNAPQVEEVIPQLLDFIGDDYLAAHNASFDEKFLLAEAQQLGLMPRHRGVICSVKLARRLAPGLESYSLGPLAMRLGIRFKGKAHRAEADAEVAAHLLLKLSDNLLSKHALEEVDPELLVQINRLNAAKVSRFLQGWMEQQNKMEKRENEQESASINKTIRYRHYKGGIYELVCEATQESDLSPVIVYRSHDGSCWTRPKSVFFEMIEVDGKEVQRFVEIND
jgi:DNA polymerase-3 subunit epsilon